MTKPGARRMSGADRRRQVLDAAAAVVARGGFAGTSTDDVARAAGVSQPYVVRMFGSKAELLAALYARTCQQVLETFRAVPAGPGAREGMGNAYIDLVADRVLLQVLMHGFSAGGEIGARGREVLAEIFGLFQERTGGGIEEARDFLAYGMLINVLVAAEAPAHAAAHPGLADLVQSTLGDPPARRDG